MICKSSLVSPPGDYPAEATPLSLRYTCNFANSTVTLCRYGMFQRPRHPCSGLQQQALPLPCCPPVRSPRPHSTSMCRCPLPTLPQVDRRACALIHYCNMHYGTMPCITQCLQPGSPSTGALLHLPMKVSLLGLMMFTLSLF